MDNYQGFDSLTSEQVAKLTQQYGKNVISAGRKISFLEKIIRLLLSPLVLFLIVVGTFSFITGEVEDAIFIFAMIVINTTVGYIQERRAQQAIDALKDSLAQKTKVIRDNKLVIVDTKDIVPGDIVVLDTGDRIPGDGKVLQTRNISINESQLSGESLPVDKDTTKNNYLYMGTFVVSGKGVMQVDHTGMHTKIGEISLEVSKKSIDSSPIEKKIAGLTKIVIVLILMLFLGLLGLATINGQSLESIFSSAVAFAISSTPESLPIILLITLAVGAYRMQKQEVILRNLPSTATLASVDIICTDKTGTLTEGKLRLIETYTYAKGELEKTAELDTVLLRLGALCNGAVGEGNGFTGDILDIAILEKLKRQELDLAKIRSEAKIIDEIPFDSDYKYHATLHDTKEHKNLVIVKGAVEKVLELCDVSDTDKENIAQTQERLAGRGHKVIMLAKAEKSDKAISKEQLGGLEVVGFLVFSDVVRPDVKEVVDNIIHSGISVMMVTGDQFNAAKTIAADLGILQGDKLVLNATDVDKLSDKLSDSEVAELAVIARANPGHKLELVTTLQRQNRVVAMTGDGVNDAPALVKSDIGIAMGRDGTDVARESADMVLVDNKFTSIVSGIEEARVVFENIRKVISYLFVTAIGETVTVVGAMLAGLPIPLTATQILYLNLATDGALDVALAGEPKERDVINFKPERYRFGILTRVLTTKIILQGLVMGIAGVLVHQLYLSEVQDLVYVRSAMLVFLTVIQWFIAFSCRTTSVSIFQAKLFANKAIFVVIITSFISLCAVIYTPFLERFMNTVPVNVDIWLLAFAFGIGFVFFNELRKYLRILV